MGDPPQLSVKIPSSKEVQHTVHDFTEKFSLDFLLLTAVDLEFRCCYRYLQKPLKYYDENTGFVYVGKMGDETEQEKLTVGLMQCGMGSGVRGSAMAVQNAVMTFNPKGVFCVGFCGGLDANKAKLGDVAVSAKLISYASCKVTEDGIQLRGEAVPLGKRLSDIMIHAGYGWIPPLMKMEETGPKVVLGTMLSGPMLVNSKFKRDELLKDYAGAIAIEMEGEGVYTAAHNLQIEWVVVKGISDYADGTKDSTTKWKPFASMMAASLVAHVLRQPSIFQGWPRYNGGSFPLAVQCGTCMRRNSAKQDLPEDRENVDGYLKQMVVEAKDKFAALFSYLEKKLHLIEVTFEGNSIKINVTCRSLQILEGLWDDYCSGHLNAKAEECLITEKVKDELGMENITLTTTILKKDYLACKEFLTKISGSAHHLEP